MGDFKKIEKKWQKRWGKAKIFEADPSSKKKFFITVPYPYVSGPYHIGHGRSYTCGDIFARFRRAKGFNVLFPMAFHITGTPVLAVSKIIKSGNPKDIEVYREYVSYYVKDKREVEKILKSFAEPINVYKFFSKTMRDDFVGLGMSLDWRRDFTTGDKIYNKFIEWQFRKFKEKNYLVKGSHPVNYCLNCENAVGEDDIKDGDTNPVTVTEYTLLKFKFGDGYLVAATLRPETIFGQTNLWVNPKIEYVKLNVGKETWIASKECVEKLSYQKENVKVNGKISGRELVGKYCRAPGVNKEIIILPSSFCDSDVGSGVVTSVPSDAPYDWIALRDLQINEKICKNYGLNWEEVKKIEPIPIIKTKELGNLAAKTIVEKMEIKNQNETERLEEATEVVYKTGFHTGVMNKNCGKYAGMSVQKTKELVKQELLNNSEADIFYETSRKAVCRCGGKVIIAKIKDQWFLDYNAKGWKELANKCLNQMTIYPEKYRKSFEDTFAWLDKRPCARKRGLGTELPFEKGWIIESLSDSTIYMAFYTIAHIIKKNKIKPEQLIPEVFDYIFLNKGSLRDIDKKSKIKQNVLKQMKEEFEYWYPLDQRHTAIMHISNHLSFFIFHHAAIFPEKYWPKIVTLIEPVIVEGVKMGKSKKNIIPLVEVREKYGSDLFRLHMAHSAEFGVKVDWKDQEVQATKKQLERLYRLLNSQIKKESRKKKELSTYSKAIMSRFLSKIKKATDYIENFELKKYTQVSFYDMMNEINDFIERGNKDEVKILLPEIFKKWLIILSPLVPHICEEFWKKLGNKKFVSLEKWPEIDEKLIDKKLLELEDIFRKTMEDLNHLINFVGKKEKLFLYFVTDKEYNYFKESLDYLKKQFEFKKIQIFKVSDKKIYDPQNKASKAKYGKPGIYLE